MSQSFTTQDGITLEIPGTYVSVSVKSGQGGIAQAGVVTIIGEADQGPGYLDEASLDNVAYTPDQFAAILSKYGSGRIVDAFRAIVAAANDPAIVGAVSQVNIIKTNRSAPALASIVRPGFGAYAGLIAKRFGAPGNLIKYSSAISVPEAAPVTSAMAYTPHYSATPVAFDISLNGGAVKSVSVVLETLSSDLVAAINDIAAGIMVTGGLVQQPLTGDSGITLSAATSGSNLVVSLASGSTFSPAPAVGSTVVIPDTGTFGVTHVSAIKGTAGVNNVGSYIITQVSNTASNASITMKRINAPSGATQGSASGAIDVAVDDILVFTPVTIANKTGMDRQSTVGILGQFVITSNDGVNVVLTTPVSTSFAAQPVAGDTVKFASAFGGITAGFYQVTASTSTTVSFTRISDGTAGNTTSPANIASPIIVSTQPFVVLKPVIDGVGKTMEFAGNVDSIFQSPSTLTPAGISNDIIDSTSEYENAFTVSQGTMTNTYISGADIYLEIGSSTALSTVVVGPTKIDFKVGATIVFTATYSQYKTLNDVVDFINSHQGWTASVGSAKFGNVNPNLLDEGTFGAYSGLSGAKPARIKADANEWSTLVGGSGLVYTSLLQSGLPEATTLQIFLSGGAKNGTSSAEVVAAIDACQLVDTNFMNPLFSADAGVDISSGDTESSSAYTIDAINAYIKAHVIMMSAEEMRKPRIAIVSKEDTYVNQKEAAGELSSYRVAMCFQDVKNVNSNGQIVQYQPWMTAIIASGMQAAAGYKGIVKKFANISGIVKADFNAKSPGMLKDALKSGMLILEPVNTGGFRWVSDQMTYSVDSNFVYNSLQAVYLADLMTLDLIATFDRAVVGQSVADISAAAALSILDARMFDYLRLKWIAQSDDAVKGYKNAVVKITGGVCQISVEAKLAGLLYFCPISFTLSQVTQSA